MVTAPDPSPPNQPRRRLKRYLGRAAIVLVLAIVIFVAGPRNDFGPSVPTQRELPPPDIATLDDWITSREAAFADIKPGNAKGIVWHSPARERTAWAVVYLHGFSASRLETAPVADRVAQALGANLFYTRLAGHGRSAPTAMGEASVQDWMADALEALRVGQTLGERVLVISCSTGSTLATWLALTPEGLQVAAHAFISPNFGPRDKRSELINGPWGRQIALALEGETRGRPPANAREGAAWTSRYPTRALFPMMAMVKQVRESDMAAFHAPVLMLYSEQDQTVDPLQTRSVFERIASPNKTALVVDYSESRGHSRAQGNHTDGRIHRAVGRQPALIRSRSQDACRTRNRHYCNAATWPRWSSSTWAWAPMPSSGSWSSPRCPAWSTICTRNPT